MRHVPLRTLRGHEVSELPRQEDVVPAGDHHCRRNSFGGAAIIDGLPPEIVGLGVIHPILPPRNTFGSKNTVCLAQWKRLDRSRGKDSHFPRA